MTSIPKNARAVNPSSSISNNGSRPRHAFMLDRTPTYSELLQFTVNQVQQYLYMPDPAPFVLVLAAVAANLIHGSPVWLMLVAPASSGKTELLDTVLGVPNIHRVATFTEAALLSGAAQKTWAPGAKGGLLKEIGDSGILLAKDFTSILTMGRDQRAAILSALREIYDGYWVRHLGTEGATSISWTGKLGFLGGVTDIIDSHHSVISAMGDRFLYCRLEAESRDLVARKVIQRGENHLKGITDMHVKLEIQNTVKCFIDALDFSSHDAGLDSYEMDWLTIVADIAALSRSAVERDNYGRGIVRVLKPESPGRLASGLSMLFRGLRLIGCSPAETVRLIRKVATDCMPSDRSRLILMMAQNGNMKVEDMRQAEDVLHPSTAIRRELEDMECLDIARRQTARGQGGCELWSLHQKFNARWNML